MPPVQHEENLEEKIENSKVSLKTVAIIVSVIVGYVIQGSAIYFPMRAQIDEAMKNANDSKTRLDKFNPDVIVYQVSELKEQVKESNKKADDILTILRTQQ